MTTPVPDSLQKAFEQWTVRGKPEDEPTTWKKASWEKALAGAEPVRDLLGGWPAELNGEPLSRKDVTAFAAKVTPEDRASQLTAFLAAMIWGYGRVGYGPSRVVKMLAEPGFLDDLAELTRTTLAKGGVAAYERAWEGRFGSGKDRGFLKHLGPAFGTKYIYFLTRAQPVEGQGIAPVLDSVVRMWFRKNAPDVDVRIGDGWGHADRYETYVKTMLAWEADLGIPADDIERLIFVSREAEVGGTWAEPWADAPVASAEELLQHLGTRIAELGLQDEAEPHLEALADLLAEAASEDHEGGAQG